MPDNYPSFASLPSDVLSDLADAYRSLGGTFKGFSAADPKTMARALTRLEDEYELSRSKGKQALRSELKTLRRALEAQTDD